MTAPNHTPAAIATTPPPAIGQRWDELGGIYAGPVAYPDGRVFAIGWANDVADVASQIWGKYNQKIAGAFSAFDGRANTLAMAEEGCLIAQTILAQPGGCYMPSQMESLVLAIALKKQLGTKPMWTSTQYSAHGAWVQHFYSGNQILYYKDHEFRAVPVRRLLICYFATCEQGSKTPGEVVA